MGKINQMGGIQNPVKKTSTGGAGSSWTLGEGECEAITLHYDGQPSLGYDTLDSSKMARANGKNERSREAMGKKKLNNQSKRLGTSQCVKVVLTFRSNVGGEGRN